MGGDIMKRFLIELGLLVSLTAMFVGSFLHDYSFMNGYWQYGPVALFFLLILILAIFEHFFEKDDESNDKQPNNHEETPADFRYVIRTSLLVIYIILLSSVMKLIFGPPEQSTYNIGSMDFWILLIIIVLTMCYRVWNPDSTKKTHS